MTGWLGRVGGCLLVIVTTAPLVTAQGQSSPPRWTEVPALCGRLQKEGWQPANPSGGSEPARAAVRVGGALDIYLCRVKRTVPAEGRGRAAELEVFMQHRGGHNATITARVWRDTDREATLQSAADLFARMLQELRISAPGGLSRAIRTGDPFADEQDGLSFRISTTTRDEEIRTQPDLKPEDVPRLAVVVSVEPIDQSQPGGVQR